MKDVHLTAAARDGAGRRRYPGVRAVSAPWSPLGRIVLVEDVTRSERPRLDPVRPDGGLVVVTLLLATLWGFLLGFLAAALVCVSAAEQRERA